MPEDLDWAYTSWLGIGFDCDEWEWGIGQAADRAGRCNCSVPRILIVWEIIQPEFLPRWTEIAVPLVRLAFRHHLIGRIGRPPRPRYPKVLTPGYYGLEETEIPF